MRPWHSLTLEQTYQHLDATTHGLSDAEAQRRLGIYGSNEPALHNEPWWKVVIEPFKSVFIAVLLLAALVSGLSHELLDSVIIMTIICINAVIYYTQYFATNRVLRSLRRQSVQSVQVLRDGQSQTITSLSIVPGDVLVLSEGQRIPADARLLTLENFQVDESSLTGESLPITKGSHTLHEETPIYERHNMAFQGTYAVAGTAHAMVVATGAKTEFGALAKLATTSKTKSPVQERIDSIITTIIKVLGGVAVVVFMLSLARGIPPNEALRFVMTLSVSVVPEGLPVALTVIIVLGMRRMAAKKALVHSFKAIEDVGLVTTIATDKTGTLTRNHLSVVAYWSLDTKKPLQPIVAKTIGDLDNVSDPLDKALQEFTEGHPAGKVLKSFAFNQSLRMSGAAWDEDGKKYMYIKGAPEHLLRLSKISADQHKEAESMLHSFASRGYRVIALARTPLTTVPAKLENLPKEKFEFLGFVACADELRPEAAGAIKAAHEAGISVRLITGDHYETAFHIAKQIGLANHPNQIITSAEMPKDEAALAEVIKEKTVFARVLPEDKYRILTALKRHDITAMTGDGVNDVPALTNAHVGIAMGSGSDIAKDAGGIVLMDDNFASIIKAIGEGRVIYDNIRRMLFYLLSTTLGEVITMIGALLLGLPLPVLAIQILWINLVTDTAMVLPLGLEPAEDGHMKRPPRRPNEPILSRMLITRMILVAFAMATVVLGTLYYFTERGYSTIYVQTITFMVLIVMQWANAFNARSEHVSLFQRFKKPNPGLAVGFLVAVVAQAMVMLGPLKSVFSVQAVQTNYLIGSSVIGVILVITVVEIHKAWVRRHMASDT